MQDQLLPAGEREENIPCDLNDCSWFEKIDASDGAVFFAACVFYYFLTEQVKALVQAMVKAFPDGRLAFDTAAIQDVGSYFSISDAKNELSPQSRNLQISSRGYMLGYQSLDYPSVSGFFRFLAKLSDRNMKMQIVRLDFSKEAVR